MTRLTGWRRSLSARLAVTIIFGNIAIITVFDFVMNMVAGSPSNIVTMAAFHPLTRSVVAGPNGGPVLAPTADLAALMRNNPTLRIAAVDPRTQRILSGSDAGMTTVLEATHATGLDPSNFAGDTNKTSFGDILLVTHADRWLWSELPRALVYYLTEQVKYLVLIGVGLALPVIVVVMMSLRPLRRSADLAERLSLRTLDGRVPTQKMPREVLPFVRSINAVLDRLDTDVQRQRRFISNAAHELRTPVSVLKARLDTMPDSPFKRELTGDSDRIAGLIQQLLTIARLGDLALPLDQDIEMVASVRDIVADYAPVAIDRGRSLGFLSAEPAITIRGNRQAFESAVFNVIDNALRAEPLGGSVEVVVGPGPVVSIVDHGGGIDPADTVRLFEPFWRKDNNSPGSGLGLPIVHECMRLHRGQVRVDSRPGEGATFQLDFAPAGEGGPSVRG